MNYKTSIIFLTFFCQFTLNTSSQKNSFTVKDTRQAKNQKNLSFSDLKDRNKSSSHNDEEISFITEKKADSNSNSNPIGKMQSSN